MTSFDDINQELNDLLPQSQTREKEPDLEGQFQALSSLGGHLGVYRDLTNPSKDELLSALYDLNVRNADSESVFDFLQVDGETTKGFIRSKTGEWIEQEIAEDPTADISGTYGELAKVASFLGLYEKYGLDGPSKEKLQHALVNYGVEAVADEPNKYIAPLQGEDGTDHLIGIETGNVTTGYPIDSNGQRIGDDEYTRDLLPKLAKRLGDGSHETSGGDIKQFVANLPDNVENLLDNERVAQNYQYMMHRLAEQAAGDDISDAIRTKKLEEARFITEVLSGERTWE
ncbi:hypothetical protein KTS45_18605 [Halomicroarcula limicola]|uniref:Uncharacterized protein n=1 Tax=Haloarcula limicola TaxID=1429915 RepID=A0A8J7Y8H6_9EURY|nr:hypothetical protein [Halomicroarcula limicola]MBV0926222.1 hypothetical protein [Halomicroarcula limicola]